MQRLEEQTKKRFDWTNVKNARGFYFLLGMSVAFLALNWISVLALRSNLFSYDGNMRDLADTPSMIFLLIGIAALIVFAVWNIRQFMARSHNLSHGKDSRWDGRKQHQVNLILYLSVVILIIVAYAVDYFILKVPEELYLLLIVLSLVPLLCTGMYWIVCRVVNPE